MRFLGITLAYGGSAETKVFAQMISAAASWDIEVFSQWSKDIPEPSERFETMWGGEVTRIDAGWRTANASRPKYWKFWAPTQFLRSLVKMERLARQFRPDVIYSSQQRWDVLAATWLAWRLKVPRIVHLHYVPWAPGFGRWARTFLRSADRVITVSDFVGEMAVQVGVHRDRIVTVPNAIGVIDRPTAEDRASFRREFGFGDNVRLIGMVARVDPSKQQDHVIEAFAKIDDRCPEAQLVFVGGGDDYQEELKQLAQRLGVSNRIRFLGGRSDVPRILAGLDIFIHPSHLDPAPLATLEAQAAGLPVIAYAEGGIPEFVTDGETGILVEPDDIAALGEAIAKLVLDPALAVRMGQAAKTRMADHFSPKQSGARFKAAVEELALPKTFAQTS